MPAGGDAMRPARGVRVAVGGQVVPVSLGGDGPHPANSPRCSGEEGGGWRGREGGEGERREGGKGRR